MSKFKKPEYVDGKMIYYCNIGCCPEECGCCDCEMNATKEDNTKCKEHVPDHPANFDKEKHIEYPRRMFIEKEVQNEFFPVQLPNAENTCDVKTMFLIIVSSTDHSTFFVTPVTT